MPHPLPRDFVDGRCIDTADAFLDALSPRAEPWSEKPTAWVYRGQADAQWFLKATAVRDLDGFRRCGVAAEQAPKSSNTSGPLWSRRRSYLDLMLHRFKMGLDRSGLVVPAGSPRTDSAEHNIVMSGAEPERETFPLMALAQHHGLPTLLLDWSRRAYVAAYFAAADAVSGRGGSATHLAVWALRRNDHLQTTGGLQFYDAPGGTNPNLHAQAGLFTYLSLEDDPSLEEQHARLHGQDDELLQLIRFTLPVTQAGKLLRLLSYEGVDGAAMFPGFDGVVRAMRESALWDRPPAGSPE